MVPALLAKALILIALVGGLLFSPAEGVRLLPFESSKEAAVRDYSENVLRFGNERANPDDGQQTAAVEIRDFDAVAEVAAIRRESPLPALIPCRTADRSVTIFSPRAPPVRKSDS